MINDENCCPQRPNREHSALSGNKGNSGNAFGASRATKVFGNIVDFDCESTHSLSYSPSPISQSDTKIKGRTKGDEIPTPRAFKFDHNELNITENKAKQDSDRKRKILAPISNINKAPPDLKTVSATRKVQHSKHKKSHKNVRMIQVEKEKSREASMRKMREAVDLATESVNESLNSVRRAKKDAEREKKLQTARLREERRVEKEEAEAFQVEADRTKRQMMDLKNQLSTALHRSKAERYHVTQQARRDKIMKEMEFKSEVFRSHQRDMAEAEERRRRQSLDIRSKIRAENRLGEETMKLARIEEDQALLEERQLSSEAWREAEKVEAEIRRQSFAFRNEDGKRQREEARKQELDEQAAEHESYELKWAGNKDAQEYASELEQRRRESFAFRNEEGKRQRDLTEQQQVEQLNSQHESYELKWAAEKDVEAYKEALAEEKRKSLQFRNQEGKRLRDINHEQKREEIAREHESFELKWEAERDAEKYRQKLSEERRNSFGLRNREGQRHRELVDQLKAEQRAKDNASYELKWAGEKDAEEYEKHLAEERRKSFVQRNEEGKRQRELSKNTEAEQRRQEHENYEIKWAGDKDGEAYEAQLEKDRRDSFAFRNKEARRQRDIVDQMKSAQHKSEHENYELKWAGERDAETYREQMALERRNSFALRNEGGRRQRDITNQIEAAQKIVDHESYELKWAGEKDAEEYRKQMEEARRDSFAFRNKEGRLQRDISDKTKEEKQVEQHMSYELKWEGEKDSQAYREQVAKERRESFAFRNQEGKRQRELAEQNKRERHAEEHESYCLKWEGEKDAEAYREEIAEERRASFKFRCQEGKRKRELVAQLKTEESAAEHESYELKWAGEDDAKEYMSTLADERRESFAFRNEEGRRQRELVDQMNAEQRAADHESHELKWAAEKDAEAYEKQMAKERRESFAFRNAEGKRQREFANQVKSEEKSQERDNFELKWAGQKDAEAYKQRLTEERRASLASRNREGVRQRDLVVQMKSEQKAAEHQSYMLKWEAEKDTEEYKERVSKEERESLRLKNLEGRRQRDHMEQIKSQQLSDEHEMYQLKWEGEKDAEEYNNLMKEERRESFAFRNAEGKRQRDLSNELKAKTQAEEHENYALKWAGEKDSEMHKKQMAKERRESFAFRNQEGARQKAVMEELQSLAREKEHESLVLKWAGEDDVKEYLSQQNEERRQSLAFRNKEGVRHRDLEKLIHEEAVRTAAEEELLQAAVRKDVEQYKEDCAEKRRTSLQFRRKEAQIQRMKTEEQRLENMDKEHENHDLEAAARKDVLEYVEECKKRDRLSLVFRAKEKRHHLEWAKRQAEMQREERSRETRYRAMDNRYMQLAKEKERAQRAIDAIRHAGRIARNPFASLLD